MGNSESSTEWFEYQDNLRKLEEDSQLQAAYELLNEMKVWTDKVYGPYHPNSIQTSIKFGALARQQGKLIAGLEELLNAKQRTVLAFLDDHPLLIEIYQEIALIYLEQELYYESESYLNRAVLLSIQHENLEKHAVSRKHLLALNEVSGTTEAIEDCHVAYIDVLKELSPTAHNRIAQALKDFGEFYCSLGEFESAVFHLSEALAMFEDVTEQDDIQLGLLLHNLGTAYLGQDLFEEARGHLSHAIAVLEKNEENYMLSFRPQMAMAALALRCNEQDEAINILNHILSAENKLDQDFLNLQQQAQQMLHHLEVPETPADETDILEGTQATFMETSNEDDMAEVSKLFNAALLELNSGKWAIAADIFGRVLKTVEQNQGENHPELVPIINYIVLAYQQMGLTTKAQMYQARATRIKEMSGAV